MIAAIVSSAVRRQILAIALFAGVFCWPSPATAQSPEPKSSGDVTVDQIFAAWAVRHEQVHSGRFKFTEELILMPGSQWGRGGRSSDDNGKLFPEQPLTLLRECDVVFEEERVKHERRGESWNAEAERPLAEHFVELDDGEKCLTYFGVEQRSDQVHPLLYEFPSQGKQAGVFPGRLPGLWPLYMALRPREPRLGPCDTTTYRLLDREGTVDGRRCLILEHIESAEIGQHLHLWVDPERDFCIVRKESGSHGVTLFQLDIQYSHDQAGLWIPSAWVNLAHARQRDGTGRLLRQTSNYTMTQYHLNPEVDDEEFTFEPPDGTSAQDYTSGEQALYVMRDSEERPITNEERMRGARYSDLMATESGKALLPAGNSSWSWTWMALAVAVAGFAWVVWRRR